ncbi:hypothetical protein EYB53_019670 [Candidatus Chloroploca sp. M-50]|uniref:Uncharacterized protein n=1 Tax=Candidatus Chloroploca mongolica TaxID=2528176 RepID=A0ABS4DER5_9CHLR|nr:hypothetical protein [Candidatus Chloroploca mongolica]MBP1467945.1 hypothetical protein [Candidatus Chloroploca mongolica]
MTDRQTIIPLAERTGDVYGDKLRAVISAINDERRIDVPVRPLCTNLGLSWRSQRNRINRDEVLREALRGGCSS